MSSPVTGQDHRWCTRFLTAVAYLFLVTATAKLLGYQYGTGLTQRVDPVFSSLSARDMLFVTVGLEYILFFALIVNFVPRHLKLLAVYWTSVGFGGYRWIKEVRSGDSSCGCLGPVGFSNPIVAVIVEGALLTALIFIFVGSVWFLTTSLRGRRVGAFA